MQWLAVAAAAEVGTRPVAVVAGGVPLVVVRPQPDAEPVAFADRCPHRLVPLSAATPVAGGLRCAYHGWEFDFAGACVRLPSQEGDPPPRAHLAPGPRVRVRDGAVQVAAADLPGPDPDDLFTNEDPALARAWHPVGLAGEDTTEVRLLGQVFRPAEQRTRERWGLLWLAPGEPLTDLFTDPDEDDRRYVGAWLPPVRTPASAGVVADNFLDTAHCPFAHAKTFGAAEETGVERYEVTAEEFGCRSVQEQWFGNPEDPGVA